VIVHKAYRLELDPNNVQRSSLNRAAGARRFAFNWALERVSKRELKPNQFVLINAWNQWKHEGAPWWNENSKFCYEEAFEDVTRAFQNFFRDPAKFKYPTHEWYVLPLRTGFTGSFFQFQSGQLEG